MAELISYGFLTPPAVFILLGLAGALLAPVWRRTGIGLTLAATAALYLLATPALSSLLLRQVEAGIPTAGDLRQAQAIIVLGGDVRTGDGGGADTLGPLSLERVAYGAAAYRRLHLPVAVSGGRVLGTQATEASLMKAALEHDFQVPVRWREDRSRTTFENARETAALLKGDGIRVVLLVTQAWHLPRSSWAFERVGLHALPWPAPRTAARLTRIDDYLPSTAALADSHHALHEMLGALYYRWRY